MYNTFEKEGEPTEGETDICSIFKQVDHSFPPKSIELLKYQMATNPSGNVSYTTAENDFSTAVS